MGSLSGLLRTVSVAAATAAAGVLLLGGPAHAANATIEDNSKVLDQSTVYNTAQQLPDPVDIVTTINLANDPSAFDQHVQARLAKFPTNEIVVEINTQSHHIAIRSGSTSHLSPNAGIGAAQAFKGAYQATQGTAKERYTAGVVATLQSLKAGIPANGAGPGQHVVKTTHVAKKSSAIGLIIGIIIAILVLAVVIAIVRWIFRSLFGGGRRTGPGYGPRPGYGPGPGYGPPPGPGYGGGYGPGYGGRGGISPGAAAGLGAVGGGLLGYELGKMEGEHEERREEYYDNGGYNQGGGYDQGGGGYDQNWGGGGGDADFGDGGGYDGGGGGDW